MAKRVLSVGQCGPDHAALSRFLQSHFDVEVTATALPGDTFAELAEGPFDLILVNRKLDADYSDGLEIIRTLKEDPRFQSTPVMLVTNYPEHHEKAVAAGAVWGFGKLEYSKPETLERLRPFLAG